MTKDELFNVISGCKNGNQVRKALEKAGYRYDDQSWTDTDGKEQTSIYLDDRRFRIYKPYREKKFVVKENQVVEMFWSGIPVFMPSGKDTFGEYF